MTSLSLRIDLASDIVAEGQKQEAFGKMRYLGDLRSPVWGLPHLITLL